MILLKHPLRELEVCFSGASEALRVCAVTSGIVRAVGLCGPVHCVISVYISINIYI